MRDAGRCLRWSLFLAFLVAVGAGVFVQVRYRPRCVIQASLEIMHVAADGTRLIGTTVEPSRDIGQITTGATAVWDLAHGQQERVLFKEPWEGWVLSPDKRLLAVAPGDASVRLIDWRAGTEHVVRIEPPRTVDLHLRFSPGGHWLSAHTLWASLEIIIDAAKAKPALVQRLDALIGFDASERRVFFLVLPGRVSVWSLETGELQGEFAVDKSFSSLPDGRALFGVEAQEEPAPAGGVPQLMFRYAWWELETLKKRVTQPLHGDPGRPRVLLANASYFVIEHFVDGKKSRLAALELPTGRIVVESPFGEEGAASFSPDGSLLRVDSSDGRITMFELPSGRELWRNDAGGYMSFAGATGVLLHHVGRNSYEGIDARTGKRVWGPMRELSTDVIDISSIGDALHFLLLSQVERQPYFWDRWLERIWPEGVGDSHHHALIIDKSTGRELFRLRNNRAMGYQLSADGSTLIGQVRVNHQPSTIRVWDVHPRRAWT
jgi:WD40 repeat protein